MSRARNIICWIGVIVLGLINGVLEDLTFLFILVPNMPPSWDLTGDLFFTVTVPLAQLMAVAVTGTLAWFLFDLRYLPRLIAFWVAWSTIRGVFLSALYNPLQDVLTYLLWIAIWCTLIGLLARWTRNTPTPTGPVAG
ncbi:MAG: hypothetical protein AAF513_02705 [Pseudomonadota bacterium]